MPQAAIDSDREGSLRKLALAAAGFVAALGLLSFLAFLLEAPQLAAVFPNRIPMAPVTAGCFAAEALALLLWQSRAYRNGLALKTAAVLVLITAAAVLAEPLRLPGGPGAIPLWKMSPFTAGLFIISSFSLVRLARRKPGPDRGSLAANSALLVFSFLILLGYLYGSPFFYGGSTIPVAFTTGLCFFALSLSLFASDRESLLSTPFFGDSLKAVLFRNFLPLVFIAVLLDKSLDYWQPALFHNKPAMDTLHALIAMAASAWLASRISARIGDKVALAQEKQRQAEREKDKLNQALAESKQDMENLLFIASHDLRTPLVNIHGFAVYLEEDLGKLQGALKGAALPAGASAALGKLSGDTIPTSLRFIFEGVKTMNQVINTLLKVARLGREEVHPEALDIKAAVNNVLDTLRYQLKETGCEVSVGELPPCKADADAVSHIFTNLLSNAIKYRDRSRRLEISVRGEKTGAAARYSVADNGLGIKETDLTRIWQLFYSARLPGVEKGEGIGLPLIRRLAQKNSGKIWAESKEGTGSTFFVELPSSEES